MRSLAKTNAICEIDGLAKVSMITAYLHIAQELEDNLLTLSAPSADHQNTNNDMIK